MSLIKRKNILLKCEKITKVTFNFFPFRVTNLLKCHSADFEFLFINFLRRRRSCNKVFQNRDKLLFLLVSFLLVPDLNSQAFIASC